MCAPAHAYSGSTRVSVYRELTRGKAETRTGYSARISRERTAALRKSANQQHRKLHESEERQLFDLIRQDCSPDQAGQAVGLSHAAVYRWLWSLPRGTLNRLRPHLRHPKLRRRYGTRRRERQRELAKKCWIDDRPDEVNQRLTYGH